MAKRAAALPAAPERLDEDGRAEWLRALGSIEARDVKGIDLTLLEVYCQAFARWLQAERTIAENGTEIVIRNDKGEVKMIIASPQILVSQKAYEQMVKARKGCGLERAREIVAAAA